MILTFKDLRDEVLRRLDEAGDTGTTKSLVNDLLNIANQHRAVQLANDFLVMDATLATSVGRQEYSLHEEFMRPLYFRNTTTKKYLEEVPDRNLQPEGYDIYTETGSAAQFALWGRSQVWRQPPDTGSVIKIVSSSASDDASAPQVLIRGEQYSDGQIVAEILTPNGTSTVTSSYTYRRILRVTRAGTWTGTMTMTDSDGNTLLVLPYCDLGKNYQQIFLFQSPTAVETIKYRFYRNPQKLVNDYDQPDIPPPFSQLLVYDTLVQIGGYNTEVNGQALGIWRKQQQDWEEALLQAFNQGQSLNAHVRFVRPYGGDGTWIERLREN